MPTPHVTSSGVERPARRAGDDVELGEIMPLVPATQNRAGSARTESSVIAAGAQRVLQQRLRRVGARP